MDSLLAESLEPDGAHHALAALVGEWEGPHRLWIQPFELHEETVMRGTIRPVLGGAFVVHEYTWTVDGEPQEGFALLGFDLRRGAFVSTWVDSWHNGTAAMQMTGEGDRRPIALAGSYDAPVGPPWGWRIEYDPRPPDGLAITHFNIAPEGAGEAKAVQVEYRRAAASDHGSGA